MKFFPSREYRSGSRWAFFRWKEIETGYITRLHLLQTPFFSVCVHWLNGPDPERDEHDHPVSFYSLFLKGWYTESTQGQWRTYGWRRNHAGELAKWFRFVHYSRIHTIKEISSGGAITLCFMGPKRQEWGFYTSRGWVHWKTYNKQQSVGSPTKPIGPANPEFLKEWCP